MHVATPPAEPRLHASPRVVRLLSVVFGALPATWLAALAALVFLGALDGIAAHPVARSLSALWGLAGVLGAIGGWLIVFDVGCETNRTPRLAILLVVAGIAAASILLIGLLPTLLRPHWPDILIILCAASAIAVGLFQICRVSRAPVRVVLGWAAMGYGMYIGFLALVSDGGPD